MELEDQTAAIIIWEEVIHLIQLEQQKQKNMMELVGLIRNNLNQLQELFLVVEFKQQQQFLVEHITPGQQINAQLQKHMMELLGQKNDLATADISYGIGMELQMHCVVEEQTGFYNSNRRINYINKHNNRCSMG